MLYFGYGSNMNWDEMKRVCRSPQFFCKAILSNYRLDFTWWSEERGTGVADAVKNSDSEIWGVGYEIDDNDISRLDEKEGFKPGRKLNKNTYTRKECTVIKEGQQNNSIKVFAYFVQNPKGSFQYPSVAYKNLLVTGANLRGLPKEYIEKTLEQIKTID